MSDSLSRLTIILHFSTLSLYRCMCICLPPLFVELHMLLSKIFHMPRGKSATDAGAEWLEEVLV